MNRKVQKYQGVPRLGHLQTHTISSADPSTTWVHLRIHFEVFALNTCLLSHNPAMVASLFLREIRCTTLDFSTEKGAVK